MLKVHTCIHVHVHVHVYTVHVPIQVLSAQACMHTVTHTGTGRHADLQGAAVQVDKVLVVTDLSTQPLSPCDLLRLHIFTPVAVS